MNILSEALFSLQAKVVEHLVADPYFAGLDILTEKKGDIRQGIRTALNKLGVGIAIVTPGLTIKKRMGKRIVFEVSLVIECAEIALTNHTGKTAQIAATAAMLAVDGHTNGHNANPMLDTTSLFQLDPAMPFRVVPDKAALVYHVVVTTDLILSVP